MPGFILFHYYYYVSQYQALLLNLELQKLY